VSEKAPISQFGVVELRRYTLRPGKREALIELFENDLLDSHEATGMVAIAHYRDPENPNSFVWLRGFTDMQSRRAALAAFYEQSSTWKDNRNAANATMIDSHNVLLLRDARPGSGFEMRGSERPSIEAPEPIVASFAAITVFMLESAPTDALISAFESEILPGLRKIASRVAYYVTEERPNDFPRLPVREGEWALVIAGVVPTQEALQRWSRAFEARHVPPDIATASISCETLRLVPAARSLLR
jgi:quinol monooxygenase YgiN